MEIERYGRLTILAKAGTAWTARCDCGTEKTVKRKEVLRPGGGLRSCGCLQREAVAQMGRDRNRTHGMKNTPTYRSWTSMRNRCQNPRNVAYANYGGRGIAVDPRWDDFAAFLADMGERPDGCTLDRVDNGLSYQPGNCRWATAKEQSRNRRTNMVISHARRSMTLSEWAAETGIGRDTIGYRLGVGWSAARALTEPVRPRCR